MSHTGADLGLGKGGFFFCRIRCIEILIMMEMDPGNCFQLLDSQASISDQLYCHTICHPMQYIHMYHILANTHTRSGGHHGH